MPVLTDPLGWFTLEFPADWDLQTEDCVSTLTAPDEVGVVYVCGARHTGGRQAGFGGPDFLARFLRTVGLVVQAGDIASLRGHGHDTYYFERRLPDSHWRHWSVTDDETALLISYTCPPQDVGRDARVVDDMVSSVRLYHSAPVH